ncbi:hypothetical protein Tco_1321109 [Tanacetum coccineum]
MSSRRNDGKESEYSFFEGDGSSSDEWRYYGVAGEDYEGPPIFDDDQYEEESMPFYDTDIEDVIEEEEGFIGKGTFGGEEDNIEDVVVVANDLCSSMIQTTFAKILLIIGIRLNQRLLEFPDYRYSLKSTIVGRLFLVLV